MIVLDSEKNGGSNKKTTHLTNNVECVYSNSNSIYMCCELTRLLKNKLVLIKPMLSLIVFSKHSYLKEIIAILATRSF